MPHKSTSIAKHILGDLMRGLKEALFCFAFGGVFYGMIEIAARGYTHWTMVLTGGAVLALINVVNKSKDISLFYRCVIGAVIITSLELAVGLVVNVKCGLGVWDYSGKPFNFMGQICLHFFGCWFLLSIPAFKLCDLIKNKINCLQYNS